MANKHIPKPPKTHPWKRKKAVQRPNRTVRESLTVEPVVQSPKSPGA